MLITGGEIITWERPNRILCNHAIHITGGLIDEIGPQADLAVKYPSDEVLDASGQYVMPGSICAHTHFYGAFARGLGIPGAAPADFPDILAKLWWPLDKSLDEDAIRLSALVCLADAIRHGTTTLVDHHASPNAIDGSLDILAAAVEQSGLRAGLCYEVTDRDGLEKARRGIKENIRWIQRIRSGDSAGGRLGAHFGLHASLTLSESTLEACRQAAPANTGFHIHIAEHPVDEYDSLQKSGLRVAERLQRHGILGPASIAAHCVHIDMAEAEILAGTGTWVTHQPRSNMNNAVGVAPVESYLRAGMKVCLGNDGFANAMWEEWKTAYLVHKLANQDPRRMPASTIAEMAVYNNAALASSIFPGAPLGLLQPGARADLIFVDYHPYTPLDTGNLPWHIVFGFHESLVTTTIVDGKVLMHDRKLLTLDEPALAAEGRQLAAKIWPRYQASFTQ